MLEPFVRSKDKVAIVGFSTNTRDQTPWNNDEFEIWGLNEEYNFEWMKRYDRWFQLHPQWDFTRENNANDPNHRLWLQNKSGSCVSCKGTGKLRKDDRTEVDCPHCTSGTYVPNSLRRTDMPIYMQEAHDDIPGSVKFPLTEIVDRFMADLKSSGRQLYFASSPAYMLALAMYMEFPRIELYGFEMGTNTEYHYQRANFEYLIGKASGMGYEVYIPKASALLRAKLYGYENMRTGFRQNLEMRDVFLKKSLEGKRVDMYQKEGMVKAIKEIRNHPEWTQDDLKKYYDEVLLNHSKAQALVNYQRGAIAETENMTRMYDGYFISDISGDQIDQAEREKFVTADYASEANNG